MLRNGSEISLIFGQTLGHLVLGWAPNHFVLGAQLAPGEKMLVCNAGLFHTEFSRRVTIEQGGHGIWKTGRNRTVLALTF